jgi:hypothetical protein
LLTHMRRVDKLLSIPFLLSKYILFGLLSRANFIHARLFWFQFPLRARRRSIRFFNSLFCIKFHINWITFLIPFFGPVVFLNSLFCSFESKSILIGIAFQFPFRASGFYRGNNGWGKPLITTYNSNKCSFGPTFIVPFFGLVVFRGEISGGAGHL